MTKRTLVIIGTCVVAVLVLCGAGVLGLKATTDRDGIVRVSDAAHATEAAHPSDVADKTTPAAATNVKGAPVTLIDGVVRTECFTYEVPTFTEYELIQGSGSCTSGIRWAGGDSLTNFGVKGQGGTADLDELVDSFHEGPKNEPGERDVRIETIGGRETVVAETIDGYGLPVTIYVIPLTGTHLTYDDVAITSIFVSGHTGEERFAAALRALVESIEF